MWNDGKGHDEAFMIRLQTAFAFIRENNLHALPLGRYDLENGVFANVQEYFTKEESVYEAHKKYIDLQYIVSGEEIIYVSDISEVQECVESYDETKDIAFYQTAQSCRKVKLEKDTFVILFPNDAHKPCISVCGNPSEVRKVVVKTPVK